MNGGWGHHEAVDMSCPWIEQCSYHCWWKWKWESKQTVCWKNVSEQLAISGWMLLIQSSCDFDMHASLYWSTESKSKPNLIGSAIVQLWDHHGREVAASSSRIKKDILYLKDNFFFVIQEDSRVVPDICHHNDHLRKAAADDNRRDYWSRLENQSPDNSDSMKTVRKLYKSSTAIELKSSTTKIYRQTQYKKKQ